ncbi:MAG: hypothetical protein DRQ56_04515 [Gammaproteobacteria bacterium]|nr:MAG: hypothetical protein DRQ56_04515 [Gammaproteobacteria bacterium]
MLVTIAPITQLVSGESEASFGPSLGIFLSVTNFWSMFEVAPGLPFETGGVEQPDSISRTNAE